MPFDPQFWTDLWEETLGAVVMWLPNLVGALVLLVIGWLVARFVQFLIGSLLRRLKLTNPSRRTLTNAGMDSSVSNLMARLAYWLILFVFVLAAAESLGLIGIVETLNQLVGYLPNVIAAAIILLLGSLIAQVIGDALREMAIRADIAAGPLLGQVVRYTLLTFTIILALAQLGIQTDLLIIAVSSLLIATSLALALAFGIGSRDLARNIMAGFHAKESFKEGQELDIRGHSGKLISVGTVKSLIKTDKGMVSLPNSALMEEEVTVLNSGKTE
ncbi:MAG: mechanosensitive ion channel [Anaerolineales bacterium]|nr:mechanosensitive ion channel [Anaerolineales bacterium]